MKPYNIYILIILIAAGFSCNKKKYPESTVENTSVFYFKGTVNGQPVSFGAGPDNYYMYSSYTYSNNVYNFIGDLRKNNCTNCANSLKIQINDYKVTKGNAAAKIDSSLMIRSYPLLAGSGNYSVQFKSSYNKNAASYAWDFGDGTTSAEANPTHLYSKKGLYNVCLTVKGINSCVGSICNTQKVGFDSTACSGNISASITGNNILFNPYNVKGKAPFNYLWDFGDGKISRSASPLHAYVLSGSYPVRLTITDANNDVAVANYNTLTQNDVSSCAANYQVAAMDFSDPASMSLSVANVSWTDANGNIYNSNNTLQPGSSYFNIISVEDYDKNENGQRTKKVHVQFKCMAYNGSNSVLIDGGDAVMCVAYP